MLSICIPVYNFYVHTLVESLSRQAAEAKILFEIQVIDDASAPAFRAINSSIACISGVVYKELSQNTGRSKIRNLLANEAKYENLLFLDCDALAPKDFLKKYLLNIQNQFIIAGGVAYAPEMPSKEYRLRWNYGTKRESTNAEARNEKPYGSFKTFNFMIPKAIFKKVQFDEKINGYGHEDTLFGIELKRLKIPITHINNPLIHLGLEPNDVFIEKTKAGIKNLLKLKMKPEIQDDFYESVSLLRLFRKIPAWLRTIISIKFIILEPLLIKCLKSGNPPMFIFDFYKLGYLCTIYKKD